MTNDLHITEAKLTHWLRIIAWGGATALFLLPVVAQQFSREMDWTLSDFATWAVMLLLATGAFELTLRASGSLAYRFAAAITIGVCFLLVWFSLAVGIIGSEDHPANLLYAGVLAIAVLGAAVTRARPRGLAVTTATMAIAMIGIALAAVSLGWGAGAERWPAPVIIVNTVFATAWLIAAALFRAAARRSVPPTS
jgi:hypothetical protein